MATEAGIPEVISHTKGEVEDTYSTTGQSEKTVNEVFPVELKKGDSQLNEHPETGEFISENKQVAGSTEVEIVNNVVDGNFGNFEDGSFLAAPSGPTVRNEEASKPEHCLVDELNPSEAEISKNAKHLEKGQEFGVVEETAREGEVVEEKNQKADQYDKNHDIQNTTETSSHVTKSEEVKFEVEGEEIVKNKINLDQSVNVILNQKDSADEGPRSTERETKDLKEKEDSHTEVFSNEVSSILEPTLEHDNEVSVHTPDLTVNKDVQSVSETFPKDEKTDNNLSREATLLQEEYTQERGFKEKEQDKCIDLSTEGKGSEAIYPSENIGTEDEKDLITHDHIGDASISTIAPSQESQNNETGDSVKDKLETESVADEVGVEDAEITEEEKHKEVSGTTCKEKNQDTNELSKHEKDEAPIENEIQNKSSSVTLKEAKAEDTSSQELDNPDILKVNSEIRLDDIAKESQIEVTKQSEVLEETVQVNDTASGDVYSDDNSEQELDSSSRKHEDSRGGGEGLDITEAAVEEAQDTEASNLAATEDTSTVKLIQAEELTEADSRKHKEHLDDTNEAAVEEAQDAEGSNLVAAEDTSTVKLVQAEELTESDSTKHDEPPGNSLLWQNEPEEKKLQAHLNVISEEINSVGFSEDAATIACIKEGEIKNLEEIFEKKEKGEEPIATSDTRGKEIPSEEIIMNLPPTHSDDKTESSVEEFPKNDADNSHVTHFLVEQAEVQGEKIDEAKVDSHEKGHKSNEASRKEEKPDEDESGADQGTEEKNLQHTSTDGSVPTEIELETSESTEKPEKDYGLNSEESLEPEDAPQDTSEEVKNEAEVTEIDTQKFVEKSRETEEGLTLDDVQAHNTVTAMTDDPIIQVEIPEEEAFKLRGEDESRKLESNEEISNEERTAEEVKFSIPEQIQVEISKSNQDNVKDAEKLNDEESTTEIIKEGYLNALSPENIQEDALKTLKDQENEAERPKGEIVEEIKTAGASESILSETNKDVEIFADASSNKQEEGKYLDPTEALVAKNNVEDSFSIEVVKYNDDNTVKESERQLELASESEEDQQQTVQKDEPGEKHENLLHLAPEETETEPSSENARGPTLLEVEGTIQNLEDTSETEKKGEKAENTDSRNDFEKEISEELETAGAGESIPRETKEDVENLVVGSLVKQEEQKEVEVVEEDYENSVKATETSIDVASKHEANQQISPEETEAEPGDKLENVLQAMPEEPETKPAIENATNIICIEGEGVIQDLKETSETEKEGEKARNTDNAIDSEKEKTTVLERGTPSIETKRQTLDEQGIAEQSSPSLGEEIFEENSKEAEKISKELETNGAGEIIPRETSFVVASLVKQEERKEVDKEGYLNALSLENIQEDAIEMLKDQENEAERPKREIVEEIETAGASESILSETNKDVEIFADASSNKQEEGQQEEGKYLDPTEALVAKNNVEDSFSIEVVKYNDDNTVKESERQVEVASESEEDQQQTVQKDVPGEKHENLLHLALEETETEPLSENARGITPMEVEGTIQNLEDTSETEKKGEKAENTDSKNDFEKEISEELETTGAGESIPRETKEDVENLVVGSLVKQEEHKEVQVVEEDYESNVKATESAIDVAPKDEANQQISPEEIETEPGDKLENVLRATPEETETKPAIEDATNITCTEGEGVIQDLKETSEPENEGEKAKNTDNAIAPKKKETTVLERGPPCIETERENLDEQGIAELSSSSLGEEKVEENSKETEKISKESETNEAGESFPRETQEEIESFVVDSLVKQEEEKELDKELVPVEALKEENTVEDTFATEVLEEDYEVKATETSTKIASKGEAYQHILPEETKTEPADKLENVLQTTPEETETKRASEDATNVTCIEGEGQIQDLKETSESEKKNIDNAIDLEKEVLESTNAGQVTKEQVLRELDSVEDLQPEYTDTEIAEDTKQSQVITGLETGAPSTEVENQNSEEQGIAEPSCLSPEEEKVEESSKDIVKEKDTHFELEEHNEVTDLVKEVKPESLEDNAKPNKDLDTAKTTEIPVEEKVGGEGPQEEEHAAYGADSVSTEIHSEESLKEAEQDNKEKVKSYDITLEKHLRNSVDTEVQSDSTVTETLSEETGLNEAESDNKEQDISYNNVPKEEGLENSVEVDVRSDSVSIATVSGETSLKASEQEHEEHVESHDIAPSTITVNEEKVEENSKETEKISKESETNGAGENIPRETKEDIESFVVASLVKQEEQKEVDKGLVPVEALKEENIVEDTFATEVPKEDYEVKATETSTEVASKGEAYQHILPEKTETEPVDKLENVLQVTPEETETKRASEDATNITCIEGEGEIQNLKETSESENKNIDNSIDLEKEVLETTDARQETRERVLRELDNVTDLHPENTDTETAQDTKESQVITGLETGPPSIEVERQNLEEQGNAELSSSLLGEEIIEERSTDIIKEEDTRFELEEQNEEKILVEEIRPESLEESAKPDNNFDTTKTIETPVEEKVGGKGTQEKEPTVYCPDSVSTEIHNEETSLKEAEPDNKEKVNSYAITLEEKGLDIEVKSDTLLPEILSEETGLNEAEPDNKEQDRSYIDVPKEEEPENSVEIGVQSDSVSARTVSEETSLKEVEQDNKEQLKSYDIAQSNIVVSEETSSKEAKLDNDEHVKSSEIAPEDKRPASDVDEVESKSVSAEILSEETWIKEAKQEHEEQVSGSNSKIALEEKDTTSNVDTNVQGDFVSTKTVNEETSLKEVEPDNEDNVKRFDIAPEEKSLVAALDIEVQSVPLSAGMESEETCLAEAKEAHEERVNGSNIALEEKDLARNVDIDVQHDSVSTEIISEETSSKEVEPDNEEQVKVHGIAPEEKCLVSNTDTEVQPESVSVGTDDKENFLKEANLHEEEVDSSKTALEEKDLERSVDIDVQHVFVSTGIANEETSLKQAKPEDEELDKSFDIASENKGPLLESSVDTEVKSEVVSASTESEETCLEEAKGKIDEQVKSFDIAHEDKGLKIEEMDLKEAKQNDKEQVKNSDVSPEENGLASNVGGDVQQKGNSDSEENRGKKIPTITSESGEKIERKVEDETPTTRTENKEKETNVEKTLDDAPEDNLQDSSTVPFEENKPKVIESNELSDETTATDKTESGNAKLPVLEPTKEEGLLQREDDYKLESYDIEKEVADEGSLRGVEGEQAALELEANETKNGEHPRNQNLEPDDLGQKLASTSELIPKDQTEETLPLTKKSETEEEGTNIQEQNLKSIEQQILGANSEDAKEIEPELTVVNHVSETQCLNEISQDVQSTEVHEEVDKADESENTKEQVIDRESNLKEFHPESILDERAYEEKASGSIVTEFLKTTDSNENTFRVNSQAEEYTTKKDEAFVKIEADEEKLNEGILNPVDVCIALPEKEKLEQEIKGEDDDHWDKNDTSTAREATTVSNLEEAQLVDEPVKAFDNGLEERNLDLLKAKCAIPADKVELKLEERSFNLVPKDQKDTDTENIAEENLNVNEVEENKLFSSVEGIDPTKEIPDVDKEKIKEEEIRNDQAPEDGISEKQLQAPSSTLVPKYQEHETETTVKTIKDVDSLCTEKEASSPIYLQKEEPSDQKLRDVAEERLGTNETEEDIKIVHETVFESSQESTSAVRKDVDLTNQALSTGISTEQVQESSSAVHPEEPQPEATDLVRKTDEENTRGLEILDNKEDDSLATEQGEETYLKEEFGDLKVGKKVVERLVADDIEEEIIEAPSTVSTEDRIITNQDLPAVTSKDQFQDDEQEKSTSTTLKKVDEENKNAAKILYDEDSRDSSPTKTDKEKCLQEEPKEYKVSDSFGEVLGSDETKETINASQSVSETNSQSIEVVPDEKIITCEPIPDKTAEVQLVEQYGILLPGERDDGITSTTKAIEEENTKEVEVLTKTVEETRELEVSGTTVDVLGTDKIEDITEVSVTKEKENSPGIEIASKDRSLDQALPVDKDEIITDQVLPAGVSTEQLQIPYFPTSIPNEQEQDAVVTVKKIEEEDTKEAKLPNEENFKDSNAEKTVEEIRLYKEEDIQGGSNEVTKKEGGTINEVPKIEAQETEEDAENAFSPSENDETAESRRAVVEASTPDVANQKIASEFVSEKEQSHELITSIENVEIIENHLKVATTDLPTQEYQPETTIEVEQTTAKEISEQEEVRSREIPHGNRSLHIEEAQSSHEKYQEQTPTETDSVESTAAKITTSNRGASPILQDSVEETSQSAESKDIRPRNETWADREIKEEEPGAEKEADHSGIRKTGTVPAMPSLSALLQSSTEEKTQLAEHTTKEEEPKSSKEAEHSPTHEGKDDEEEHEEEEHEHEHEDEDEDEDHPDAPILVQASKDIDAKATRKKSHGIFSGVGSKVKHSISKVKKAITGKSSHSKTQPSS